MNLGKVVLSISLMALVSGCSISPSATEEESERFSKVVYEKSGTYLLTDNLTGCQYASSWSSNSSYTPVLGKDGLPLCKGGGK